MTPLVAGQGGVPESLFKAATAEPSRFRRVASGLRDVAGGLKPKNTRDVIDLARFAGDTLGAYRQGKREDELYGRDRDEYNRLAPLRQAGLQGMLDQGPAQPPVSSLFTPPPSRYRRVAVGSRI